MSRYPDNPWWCGDHDKPISIPTRSEWDEAADAGYVTPEHVMIRLKNIAEYAFGSGTVIGLDENGFITSLTSAGWAIEGGVVLHVYPKDHPPPHVHIEVRSLPHVKIRINLATGDLLDDPPRGLPAKKLRKLQSLVREHQGVLATSWQTYHGEAVEFS